MRTITRGRECREGLIGRWHTYNCRHCGGRFSRFLRRALPEQARLCDECLQSPELKEQYDRAFDERDKEEIKHGNG